MGIKSGVIKVCKTDKLHTLILKSQPKKQSRAFKRYKRPSFFNSEFAFTLTELPPLFYGKKGFEETGTLKPPLSLNEIVKHQKDSALFGL